MNLYFLYFPYRHSVFLDSPNMTPRMRFRLRTELKSAMYDWHRAAGTLTG